MQLRKFTTSDMLAVVDMLAKAAKTAQGDEIQNLITSKRVSSGGGAVSDSATAARVGMLVLTSCYSAVKEDCVAWFASLLGMTIADYMQAEAGLTLDLIESIVDSADAKDFFSRAWALFSKIGK